MKFTEQIRAARALLGWSQEDLAQASSVGVATVRRLEAVPGLLRGTMKSVWKIQQAFEQGGIEFIAEDDGKGPGVRLKWPLEISSP